MLSGSLEYSTFLPDSEMYQVTIAFTYLSVEHMSCKNGTESEGKQNCRSAESSSSEENTEDK